MTLILVSNHCLPPSCFSCFFTVNFFQRSLLSQLLPAALQDHTIPEHQLLFISRIFNKPNAHTYPAIPTFPGVRLSKLLLSVPTASQYPTVLHHILLVSRCSISQMLLIFPAFPSVLPLSYSTFPAVPSVLIICCSTSPAIPSVLPSCSTFPAIPSVLPISYYTFPAIHSVLPSCSTFPAIPSVLPLSCSTFPAIPSILPLSCSTFPAIPLFYLSAIVLFQLFLLFYPAVLLSQLFHLFYLSAVPIRPAIPSV
jgi:hypothetical protein